MLLLGRKSFDQAGESGEKPCFVETTLEFFSGRRLGWAWGEAPALHGTTNARPRRRQQVRPTGPSPTRRVEPRHREFGEELRAVGHLLPRQHTLRNAPTALEEALGGLRIAQTRRGHNPIEGRFLLPRWGSSLRAGSRHAPYNSERARGCSEIDGRGRRNTRARESVLNAHDLASV